jgi:HEAT repeat protein
MTKDQKNLIGDLVITPEFRTPRLTPDEFLRKFGACLDGKKLTTQLLRDVISSANGEDLGFAMIVGFTFGFSEEHFPMLVSLVKENWHFSHEDVVSALSEFKASQAVEGLLSATKWVPDYLAFDESRALAVKAIWALGGIEGPEADAALNEVMNDPDPILANAAAEQMKRRRAV